MLLSNISKNIEKLVHVRLTKFFNRNAILYKKQFGFRNNHSTTHAILKITEKIKQACDTGQIACGVFLNLQKAFDTVNHTTLLKKLMHYGIIVIRTEHILETWAEQVVYLVYVENRLILKSSTLLGARNVNKY